MDLSVFGCNTRAEAGQPVGEGGGLNWAGAYAAAPGPGEQN